MVLISFSNKVNAHGDLHERIEAVSLVIDQFPDSLELYIVRGKLHFQHEDYENSLIDFKVCRSRNFTPQELLINEAKCLNALNNSEEALNSIDSFLDNDEGNVRALRVKGNILYKAKCYAEAATEYEKVINGASDTFTDNYTEAAEAWTQCGTKECYDNAIKILEKGTQKLGNLVVLHEKMVKLHIDNKQPEKAILAQSKIIEQLNRKENALYKRALIHVDNNQIAAAKKDLLAANNAIQQLPPRIKNNRATNELKNNIKSKLESL